MAASAGSIGIIDSAAHQSSFDSCMPLSSSVQFPRRFSADSHRRTVLRRLPGKPSRVPPTNRGLRYE
jgi:hypothetical protein